MVQISWCGDQLILEYFTDEQWRLLMGNGLTEEEAPLHRQLVQDRYQAFLEIRDVYTHVYEKGAETPAQMPGEAQHATAFSAGGRRDHPLPGCHRRI